MIYAKQVREKRTSQPPTKVLQAPAWRTLSTHRSRVEGSDKHP